MTESRDRPGSASGRSGASVRGLDATAELDLLRSPTESRNPLTEDIDALSAMQILERINDQDALVAAAVRAALTELAVLVEQAVRSLAKNGRIHYFGAGTSGRLGLLDAAEIPPTYGLGGDVFQAHMAGGSHAFSAALEGAEDDQEQGAAEARAAVAADDLVIGIAASGSTPYVGGAMRAAAERGAYVGLITSNPDAPLGSLAATVVCLQTGAEAITGSTRMKSASAQKMALNAFSTAVMVRRGRTWSNLMSEMRPSNNKLRARLVGMVMQSTGLDRDRAAELLARSGYEFKTALVAFHAEVSPLQARDRLARCDGNVRQAMEAQALRSER